MSFKPLPNLRSHKLAEAAREKQVMPPLSRIYSRVFFSVLLVAAAAPQAGSGPAKQNLFPKLQAGQSLAYLIRFRNDKKITTQSTVVAPMAPEGAEIDAHGLLLIDILDVQPSGDRSVVQVRSRFQALDSGVWLKHPG